jgi:chorismate synthase
MRVALGEIARAYLAVFGVTVRSHVVQIGDVAALPVAQLPDIQYIAGSPVRCADADAEKRMIQRIDEAKAAGDTLGGVFEVRVLDVPVGIGSNRQPWDRLDAIIAGALMSIQTAKAVEVGEGISSGGYVGSRSHDAFEIRDGSVARPTNRAGGIEGGMSNGQDIIARVRLKPIATLMKPLDSVDMASGTAAKATIVRSDVCSVPAASVIGEAMACLALAAPFSEKYGGDSVAEVREHFTASQAGAVGIVGPPREH